ncbi:ABC transporter substrate-binding protein, partial [Streptomyces neyagawaensis]|nr:ABC transporter substrate-binding protein [Streptomyces neyagawaensis]
ALIAALKKDVPILKAAKLTGDVDVDAFVDDRYVRKALGPSYAKRLAATPAPAQSEVWPKDAGETRTFKTPAELLAHVAGHKDDIRAAYVPDATTGTQWFADKAVWVADGGRLLPFVAPATAKAYVTTHPGARVITYATALEQAS